eukprot:SAG31_NODE_1023_length_10298_cov_3.003530_2_plen_143_part_00
MEHNSIIVLVVLLLSTSSCGNLDLDAPSAESALMSSAELQIDSEPFRVKGLRALNRNPERQSETSLLLKSAASLVDMIFWKHAHYLLKTKRMLAPTSEIKELWPSKPWEGARARDGYLGALQASMYQPLPLLGQDGRERGCD